MYNDCATFYHPSKIKDKANASWKFYYFCSKVTRVLVVEFRCLEISIPQTLEISDMKENQDYVCVIGAATVDITGFPQNKLIQGDSTIGRLGLSIGGVGRNIAEILVRLGVQTKLMSPIGGDLYGKQITENCRQIGIDVEDALFLEHESSSVFMAIMNESNDLSVAIAAMSICEKIDKHFIDQKKEILENAQAIVLETNIPKDVLAYLVKSIPEQKYIVDTVSGDKAKECESILAHLDILKTNKYEAEILTNLIINNETDLKNAAQYFHARGVKNVCITLSKQGVFYSNKEHESILLPPKVNVVNTNGAGDAFVAGLVYAELKGMNLSDSVKIATACSAITIGHEDTINPNINEASVLELCKS